MSYQYKRNPVNPEYLWKQTTPPLKVFTTLTWSPGFSFTMTVLLIWFNGFSPSTGVYAGDTVSLPTVFLLTFRSNQIPGRDKESTTNMYVPATGHVKIPVLSSYPSPSFVSTSSYFTVCTAPSLRQYDFTLTEKLIPREELGDSVAK